MFKKTRISALVLTVLLSVTLLSACGNTATTDKTPSEPVDLSAFAEKAMTSESLSALTLVDTQTVESLYPGAGDVSTKQALYYIPMMSAVASELVLIEATDADSATTAKALLQTRIDAQIDGGAWYPETIEGWQKNSRLVQHGNYVMLVVSPDCDTIVSDFDALFA